MLSFTGMGLIYADFTLSNPADRSLHPVSVKALVDTGAITLCIPEHIATQLKFAEIEKREVRTAEAKSVVVPYVGPVQVQFNGRNCFTGALVLGDSVLVGSVPLEDMDLVIDPSRRTVVVNPESPNIPTAIVK